MLVVNLFRNLCSWSKMHISNGKIRAWQLVCWVKRDFFISLVECDFVRNIVVTAKIFVKLIISSIEWVPVIQRMRRLVCRRTNLNLCLFYAACATLHFLHGKIVLTLIVSKLALCLAHRCNKRRFRRVLRALVGLVCIAATMVLIIKTVG